MDMAIESFEGRFALLSDLQRKLVHLIALGRADDYLARGRNVDLPDFYSSINEITRTLRCAGGNYDEKREDLVHMGRKFFELDNALLGDEAPPAHAVETSDDRGVSTSAPEVEESIGGEEEPSGILPAAGQVLPDVETLVKKIQRLEHKDKTKLRAASGAEWGKTESTAAGLGLTHASFNAILSRIYKKLPLPNVRGRKKLLQEAFRVIDKQMLQMSEAKSVAVEVEQPQEVVLPPTPAKEDRVQQVAASTTEPQLSPAPTPAVSSGSFGSGVVLPLPADVTEVEVLSGEFTGDNPAAGLKQQLLERKRQGLTPSFLVLYPSPQNPTSAVGHIVFLGKERK